MFEPHLIARVVEWIMNSKSDIEFVIVGIAVFVPNIMNHDSLGIFVDLFCFKQAKISDSVDAPSPVVEFVLSFRLNSNNTIFVLEETFCNANGLVRHPNISLGPFEVVIERVPNTQILGLSSNSNLFSKLNSMLNLEMYFVNSLLPMNERQFLFFQFPHLAFLFLFFFLRLLPIVHQLFL